MRKNEFYDEAPSRRDRLLSQFHGLSVDGTGGQGEEDDGRIFDLAAHSKSANNLHHTHPPDHARRRHRSSPRQPKTPKCLCRKDHDDAKWSART